MNRYQSTYWASFIGIIGNILLLIGKAIVGFLTNSQAMIADAMNSFGDVFSSLMSFIGNKISSKDADNDHNLGHGKAEYIFSFVISIIMFYTAIIIVKSAITTYVRNEIISFSYMLVVTCIATIIVKFCLFIYTDKIYRKHHNILMKATSQDHRNDCLLTLLTLSSAILGMLGFRIFDIFIAIIIAVWIMITSLKIMKEAYDILMDKCMDEETKNKVFEIIKRHEEVLKVNHFNSTPVGYRYQISFTIFVDGNMSTFASHDIANKLEREIEADIPEVYLTVIHVNPMKIKNSKS